MEKHKAHFWAGKFRSGELLDEFFEETYSDNDDEPVSMFVESQSEFFIDHDFLERGYEDGSLPVEERFAGYSWANKWMKELGQRLKKNDIEDANTIIMCCWDDDNGHIENPVPFDGNGYEMKYLGVIEFEV